MEVQLKENEKIEDLQIDGLKIIQNKKWFCFGMDSVLLSDFSKDIKAHSTVVDLGSGTGIIPILLSSKTKAKKIICVEKQKEMVDLIKRNILINNLEEKIEVINTDILNLNTYIKSNTIDVVVTNPPYKNKGTGIETKNQQKYISKVETTATIEDFIITAKNILKEKGKCFIVYRPERLVDVMFLMRKYKIEPKRLQFIYSHTNKDEDSKLVLIEGVKLGNPFLKVEKNIYVYNEDESYTDEINKIYNKK